MERKESMALFEIIRKKSVSPSNKKLTKRPNETGRAIRVELENQDLDNLDQIMVHKQGDISTPQKRVIGMRQDKNDKED